MKTIMTKWFTSLKKTLHLRRKMLKSGPAFMANVVSGTTKIEF